MKITATLKIALLSLVTTLSTVIGNCQTYQLSGTIPDFGLNISDIGNNSSGFDFLSVDGATYSETVTIDPVANTIQEVGSVSISNVSNVFDTTHQIITTTPPEFPNPPISSTQTLSGVLTIGLFFVKINGRLSSHFRNPAWGVFTRKTVVAAMKS
jgi:hypothetical protein